MVGLDRVAVYHLYLSDVGRGVYWGGVAQLVRAANHNPRVGVRVLLRYHPHHITYASTAPVSGYESGM